MANNYLNTPQSIPIANPSSADAINEADILSLLLATYGPTLTSAELRKVTKVGRSSASNFRNRKHRRFDLDYPRGFALYDAANSPLAFWTRDAAKWLAKRANKHAHSQEV